MFLLCAGMVPGQTGWFEQTASGGRWRQIRLTKDGAATTAPFCLRGKWNAPGSLPVFGLFAVELASQGFPDHLALIGIGLELGTGAQDFGFTRAVQRHACRLRGQLHTAGLFQIIHTIKGLSHRAAYGQ